MRLISHGVVTVAVSAVALPAAEVIAGIRVRASSVRSAMSRCAPAGTPLRSRRYAVTARYWSLVSEPCWPGGIAVRISVYRSSSERSAEDHLARNSALASALDVAPCNSPPWHAAQLRAYTPRPSSACSLVYMAAAGPWCAERGGHDGEKERRSQAGESDHGSLEGSGASRGVRRENVAHARRRGNRYRVASPARCAAAARPLSLLLLERRGRRVAVPDIRLDSPVPIHVLPDVDVLAALRNAFTIGEHVDAFVHDLLGVPNRRRSSLRETRKCRPRGTLRSTHGSPKCRLLLERRDAGSARMEP